MAAALVLGEQQQIDLARLRQRAMAEPIDVRAMMQQIETRDGLVQHLARMESYTIPLPPSFMVTFTIEIGHPAGTCRHMSLSSVRHAHVPMPEARMVAEVLGFATFERWAVWEDKLSNGNLAINVVQPIRS